MISSQIYTDLAADRQHALIATADAHRDARARRQTETETETETGKTAAPRKVRTLVRSIVRFTHA